MNVFDLGNLLHLPHQTNLNHWSVGRITLGCWEANSNCWDGKHEIKKNLTSQFLNNAVRLFKVLILAMKHSRMLYSISFSELSNQHSFTKQEEMADCKINIVKYEFDKFFSINVIHSYLPFIFRRRELFGWPRLSWRYEKHWLLISSNKTKMLLSC